MNKLIMPHNVGVKNVLENMKEVLVLYKNVIGCYRPLLDGERYLTDREVALMLSSSRLICNASLLRPLAQLSFTSHISSGIVFLQLNWLCVPLIVTLPITGTMPWYPPRDTQSRGPSLLLTLVHIEQNVKSSFLKGYRFWKNEAVKTENG